MSTLDIKYIVAQAPKNPGAVRALHQLANRNKTARKSLKNLDVAELEKLADSGVKTAFHEIDAAAQYLNKRAFKSLARLAERHPEAVSILDSNRRLSYAAAPWFIRMFARYILKEGIRGNVKRTMKKLEVSTLAEKALKSQEAQVALKILEAVGNRKAARALAVLPEPQENALDKAEKAIIDEVDADKILFLISLQDLFAQMEDPASLKSYFNRYNQRIPSFETLLGAPTDFILTFGSRVSRFVTEKHPDLLVDSFSLVDSFTYAQNLGRLRDKYGLLTAFKFFKDMRDHQEFPALLKFASPERFQYITIDYMGYWPEQQLSFLTPNEAILMRLLENQAGTGLSESDIRDDLEAIEERIEEIRQRLPLLEQDVADFADKVWEKESKERTSRKLKKLQDIKDVIDERISVEDNDVKIRNLQAASQAFAEQEEALPHIAQIAFESVRGDVNDLGQQRQGLEDLLSFREFLLLLLKFFPTDTPSVSD